MSVTIRLSRIGRKNQPAYKLVVSNTRDKRTGKFVDIIGHFDPFKPKDKFIYDKEKFEKWKKQGALVTDAVNKLIDGKYEYVKYDPKKLKEKAKEEAEKKVESVEKSTEKEEETENETEEKNEEAEVEEKLKEEEVAEESEVKEEEKE